MKNIWIIFKKELKDILRDRRSVIMMIVMPLLLFPVLISAITGIQSHFEKKAEEKILNVAFVGNGNASRLEKMLSDDEKINLLTDISENEIKEHIQSDSLSLGVIVDVDFDASYESMEKGNITMYYKTSDDLQYPKEKVSDIIDDFKKILVGKRFQSLNLDVEIINPINITEIDIASDKEKFGKLVGGFIPYIFVIFAFMGVMFPALDLAAGEKERGTLETLLSSPASRLEILAGKFSLVSLFGILTALLSISGLYLTVVFIPQIPDKIFDVILSILDPMSILLIMSLLIPLTIFLASFVLSLSIYAKSYKEAQGLIGPLNIFIIFPVIIGTLPVVEYDLLTAAIPILNISLAVREIIAGTVNYWYLAETFGTMLLLAGVGIAYCVNRFNKEEVLFRGI